MTESSRAARLRCSEIMASNVRTATRKTSLREVAVMMRDGDMGAVPVVEEGRLVGIVTDRDIVVRAIAEGKDASSPVGEAMTTEIFSVRPDGFVSLIFVYSATNFSFRSLRSSYQGQASHDTLSPHQQRSH